MGVVTVDQSYLSCNSTCTCTYVLTVGVATVEVGVVNVHVYMLALVASLGCGGVLQCYPARE